MTIQAREKSLLEKIARGGDKKIFEEIYTTYYPEIRRFLYFRVGGNDQVAEDIASHVFLRFFEYLSRGHTVNHVRGFLYRTAKNHLANHFRDSREEISLDDSRVQDTEDHIHLESLLDIKMDAETALSLLSDIKSELRDVIIMRYLEDFDYEEIAKITEKSVENVRVMIYRGLKEIRKKLQEAKRT